MSLSLNTSESIWFNSKRSEGDVETATLTMSGMLHTQKMESYFQSDLLDSTIVETFPCLFIVAVKPTF